MIGHWYSSFWDFKKPEKVLGSSPMKCKLVKLSCWTSVKMSLTWGCQRACQIESLLLCFPTTKKKTKKKKNASRNTHIPRKKQIKQNTKSKRQREAAEVCTLVLWCCQSSCYSSASGRLEKSKRKIIINENFSFRQTIS